MSTAFTRDDVKLNFDPASPAPHFATAGLPAASLAPAALLPSPVPWPTDLAPVVIPLNPKPLETDDLTRFAGFDAVIMTWTSAEASALAALITPGVPLAQWFEYRHNIAAYIPLVTGSKAPFNDARSFMQRYYHSLGLYYPVQIGSARVLLFKSGLHLDYDGPSIPVRQLVQEIVAAVQPKMVITTGTGGAIGTQVALGDVVIASYTQFDCTQQFSGEIWAKSKFSTSPLPPGTLAKITPELTTLNAGRIPNARSQPQMWSGADATVVTTDYFAFDDSTNHDGLQGLGLACDMGDAMVGLALAAAPGVAWYSVRNASDPQIPNPDGDFEAASTKSTSIYSLYGGLTTAASVIACWAIVSSAFPPAAPAAAQTVSEIPVLASQQNVASRL